MLVACGPEDSSPSRADSNVIDIGLEGNWESDCFADTNDGNYKITVLTFTATQVSVGSKVFDAADSSCSDTFGITSSLRGDYVIGNEITTSGGMSAYEIDITSDANGLTYLDIVQVSGDELRVSGQINPTTRPQSLDHNKVFHRQ
jgi:hypothetical protein